MDSIIKAKEIPEEELKISPFKSPAKPGARTGSPSKVMRDSSITKDEYRQRRREERQRILEEFERREKMAPT